MLLKETSKVSSWLPWSLSNKTQVTNNVPCGGTCLAGDWPGIVKPHSLVQFVLYWWICVFMAWLCTGLKMKTGIESEKKNLKGTSHERVNFSFKDFLQPRYLAENSRKSYNTWGKPALWCPQFPAAQLSLISHLAYRSGKNEQKAKTAFLQWQECLSPALSQGPQGASYPYLETHWLAHTCTWVRWHLMASPNPKETSQWRCPSWESPTVPLFPPQPHSEGLAFLFLCLAFNLLKLTLISLTPAQYKYSSTSCDGFDLDTQQGKEYQDLVVSLIAVFFLLNF